ncbi:MAG: GDP-perosamine synthase [Candidatus Omnitrophica bacterium]|nr:GDP-perosamine synthase [Candidatus Omnitrophota bacterium]
MPPLKVPIGHIHVSPKARRYVLDVLRTGRLSYGPYTRRFESRFARMHGARFAVTSSSGTVALQIALAALKEVHGWPDGSEVLVPATTFIATSNTVLYNNLRPVFVDIDPVHYGLDASRMERHITRRTRAVIPVHLFGQPADMDPILAVARKHKLSVIEDSAETMYARYKGRWVGTLGDIGCFSTYIAHLLTTGVGGINTTQDPELAIILRSLMNHGRDSIYLNIDDDDRTGHRKMRLIVKKRFSFVRLGHSARTTELESALGLAQLEESFVRDIRIRRANASELTRLLSPLEDRMQLPSIRPGCEHSFMVYPIVLRRGTRKDRIVEGLERRGIETRDLMPLLNQPVYRRLFKLDAREYPVSRWLLESGFYVGCHPGLGQPHLRAIASTLRRCLGR